MPQQNHAAELEIEISYLPKRLPDGLNEIQPVRITDIYLSDDIDLSNKLRLRQKGDKYELTKKINLAPDDLSRQQEYNVPLTKKEFDLLRAAGGREVVKDRYRLAVGKHILEIDVLRGGLEGFVMIEVEFSSVEERDAFVPPEYCGTNITQEDFIAGSYLAGKTVADIQHHLDRLGYRTIKIN
jgi:CYTH domain-containing protein